MTQAIVDEAMLREPALATANAAPIGRVRINQSHPVAEKLVFAFAGMQNPELVTNTPWAAMSGVTRGPYGTIFGSTSAYIDLSPESLAKLKTATVGTAMACVRFNAMPSANTINSILGIGSTTTTTEAWYVAARNFTGATANPAQDITVRNGTGNMEGFMGSDQLVVNTPYILGWSATGLAEDDYIHTFNGRTTALYGWLTAVLTVSRWASATGSSANLKGALGAGYYNGSRLPGSPMSLAGLIVTNKVMTAGEQASLALDFFQWAVPA